MCFLVLRAYLLKAAHNAAAQKTNRHKVLQYSSFCREIKISRNRLTLQEIELQSYKSALNQEFENNWLVYFRPKFSVIAVSTMSSVYKPTHVAIVHSASKIKEQTKRQVYYGGELAVGVLSLQRLDYNSAELLSKLYNQLRDSLENKLGKLKAFKRNTATVVVNKLP
jgi:hypothetical protein